MLRQSVKSFSLSFTMPVSSDQQLLYYEFQLVIQYQNAEIELMPDAQFCYSKMNFSGSTLRYAYLNEMSRIYSLKSLHVSHIASSNFAPASNLMTGLNQRIYNPQNMQTFLSVFRDPQRIIHPMKISCVSFFVTMKNGSWH